MVELSTRGCFCLYSTGDPIKRIEAGHKNDLDKAWTNESFYPEGRLSKSRIAMIPVTYAMGMIGWTGDAVRKTITAIGDTLYFLGVSLLCTNDIGWKNDRKVFFLNSWSEVVVCLVGILIPPLAYRLDAFAEQAMKDFANMYPSYDVRQGQRCLKKAH